MREIIQDSNASDALSDAESIISFNEGGLRTMEDERISTPRYVYEANKLLRPSLRRRNSSRLGCIVGESNADLRARNRR